jgi:endonuclease/exonuclease/phosphatase family metal-dependent hydrolase
MNLITWNCFRGDAVVRAAALADLAPDVLVLQECAKPKTPQSGVHWLGGKPTQGVAVAVRSPFTAIAPPAAETDDQVAYPVRIEGPRSFNLLAVWTKRRPTYVASLWEALDRHGDWLADGPSIVAGDFNSHARWDRNGRPNHSDLVARLRDEFGLVSAWHAVAARDPAGEGREEPATIFHRRRPTAPCHIDYVFVPIAWADDLRACWVPDESAGSRGSDHRRVVVEVA